MVEEPAGIIDGLAPVIIRNPHRLLTLQPRPSVEIELRNAIHCHGCSFFEIDVIGFGLGASGFLSQRRDNLGFVLFELGEEFRRRPDGGLKCEIVAVQGNPDAAIGRFFDDCLSAQISPSQPF
ncbi:hypothetical protein QEV83_13795 [Methylocapsa sp. D3K7]|uniref:hypothetical protein n=1 Tax=Methylocapsa sp. D3K7 TaxID=3041435 RepID=UPI00244EB57B|nr:hypothetical protein [Methylocapsa sp. D3K7]WGJ13748.1 hypothetical protein QEV83_13795 [Methylocapsa sp. D3K7]